MGVGGVLVVANDPQQCPHCGSASFQKRGLTNAAEPKQRYACNDCGKWFAVSLVEIDSEPYFLWTSQRVAEVQRKERYFITCSQNNTPVLRQFWQAINRYCVKNGNELLVLPIRYKNPTSRIDPQDGDGDVWWPDEVLPFLVENRLEIHPELWVMGNMRIQATVVNPLIGLESMSQHASAIYGHGQLQMKTVPTPQFHLPKILHTTGSVSEKNYSRTKAGVKGEFHHTNAGLIVEKKGKKFHLRAVVWDGEGFYDVAGGKLCYYTAENIKEVEHVDALVTGDEHAIYSDPEVKAATYTNADSIAAALKPKIIVRHDLFDGYSISHHHKNNFVTKFVKYQSGLNKVEDELKATVQHIDETTPKGSTNVIVASNHNDHLYRWLKECDWRTEPWNAKVYHWFWYHLLNEARLTESGATSFDPFAYWAEKHPGSASVRFLKRDESFTINEIELSIHGDLGPNGARGSAINLNKIGIRSIIGHSHSPCIEKGVFQVGTSTFLRLEYNPGPSSWLNTHALVFPNGKRQLINIIEGEWRG